MSAAVSYRATSTSRPARSAQRPAFAVVQGARTSAVRSANSKLWILGTVIVGLIVIAIANLLMTLATSAGVYQVANLKARQAGLELSTQIVGQQVNSLSSNQNLANAAHALGMISNANPVYLDISKSKVYGSAAQAALGNSTNISGNLLANAEWTTRTNPKQLQAAVSAEQAQATKTPVAVAKVPNATTSKSAASAVVGGVANTNSATSQIGLAGSGIPAAVSH